MRIVGRIAAALGIALAAAVPPPAAAQEKVAASAYNFALEAYALVVDAGKDRGIYLRNGLDPEWVARPGRAVAATDLKELIAQGTHIGMSAPSEMFLARMDGVPVRIIAGHIGETLVKVYAKADGPVRTVKDLDGRKIGPTSAAVQRQVTYIARRFGINAEAVSPAKLDDHIAALRQGRIDAIITAEARALALVDQGKLRILMRGADYQPNPTLNNCIWATDDLIRRNPDLVARFVKATLETARYLKENPGYAAQLIGKRTDVPADLAAKAVAQFDWTPSGQPGGNLIAAAANFWQFLKETGSIPAGTELTIADIVDTRFLKEP